MLSNIIFGILTYLFSSIPFGLVIAKVFYKKDIRKEGSKNIGATNVLRLCGKVAGLITFLLDGLKGAIPVVISKFLFQSNFYYIVGIIAIIGHIFPLYLKFKGGKGVATTMLVIFAINFNVGLSCLLVWILSLLLFGFSSLSSILMCLFIIPVSVLNFIQNNNYEFFMFGVLCASLVIFKHKVNIQKLIKGEESKVFKKSIF